jgi:hypothetical protein
MKPIHLVVIAAVFLFGQCNPNKTPNPHAPFQGLYKLHIFEYQDSTGVWKEYGWNRGGDSYILYDGLGHMAVQITPEAYSERKVKAPRVPIDSLTIDELKDDLQTYASNYVYIANCNILEEEMIIEHQRLSHTYPFDWGVTVQRKYKFSGDTLILSPVEGDFPRRLKWIRQP